MAISAGVELDVEVGFTGLKYARFAASAGQRFSARLDANYTGAWSYGPVELGSRTFAPITFSIGPVPVVAQPSLSASLSTSGSVEASLHASLTQAESVTASLTYDGDDVVPDFERTSEPPTFSGPTADGLATGRVAVDPKVSITLYGAAEVGVTLSAYLRVKADLCLAELFGGISVSASFALSILGRDLLDYSTPAATLAEKRLAAAHVLGCWTGSFRYVSTLDVSSGGFTGYRHSDITWTVLDRVEDKPNHYHVKVTGTYDHHDVEITTFPELGMECKTETSCTGRPTRSTRSTSTRGGRLEGGAVGPSRDGLPRPRHRHDDLVRQRGLRTPRRTRPPSPTSRPSSARRVGASSTRR